ncbi:MAG: hypothetical protein M1833_002239 [Piccolia ochrophora]|nr:MAG: hypothetical protein M1833_002239 [Piccolia ochrophora]
MANSIVLHLGDPVRWNHDLYEELKKSFTVIRCQEQSRPSFVQALKDKKYGDFSALYRPFWNSGGEMGNWDEELIQLLPPSVKIFASAGAGYDWVNVERLAQSGILYCNSAAACTEAVADTALWLMLSTFRNFTWSALAARSTDAAQFTDAHRNIAALAHNPNRHILGIIGLGNIGLRIAQKARLAFNMNIVYHDLQRKPSSTEVSVGAQFYKDLDGMLAVADCVVVATPFGGSKVLNAKSISRMKQGSRLVNIARGKLIDEGALIDALERGQLVGAGLDVHFDEPNVNPRLAEMKNVEVLSHTAGAALESHVGFEKLGIENILSFSRTGKALTAVNTQFMPSTQL